MMRFSRIGWILITIFLLNLTFGMFSSALPQRHLSQKRDAATSEAGTRHIPADLQMDADPLSLPGQQISSSAADLPQGPIPDGNNPHVAGISAQGSPTHVQTDLLQRLHVFRI